MEDLAISRLTNNKGQGLTGVIVAVGVMAILICSFENKVILFGWLQSI